MNNIDLQLACSTPTPPKKRLQDWASQCLEIHGEHQVELSIRVVDEAESQNLNLQYRDKNKAANVLSFPAELPESVLEQLEYHPVGDIVICAAVVNGEAEQQGKSRDAHWAHMLVHGCLHLLGYDHINNSDATIMEDLEVQILAQLGFPNPYESRL